MAITAISRGFRCARGATLKASKAGSGAEKPAAMEAGTNPNIASPEKGEFACEICKRSSPSKWVYSNTCQAAKGCAAKDYRGASRSRRAEGVGEARRWGATVSVYRRKCSITLPSCNREESLRIRLKTMEWGSKRQQEDDPTRAKAIRFWCVFSARLKSYLVAKQLRYTVFRQIPKLHSAFL